MGPGEETQGSKEGPLKGSETTGPGMDQIGPKGALIRDRWEVETLIGEEANIEARKEGVFEAGIIDQQETRHPLGQEADGPIMDQID